MPDPRLRAAEGKDVVAFQCREPAHYELFTRAGRGERRRGRRGARAPTMGPTQDDDISDTVRYHTYETLAAEVNNPAIRWACLPYSIRRARGPIQHDHPQELRVHALHHRARHGGLESSIDGEDFYGAYDAQDLAKANAAELGMQTVPSLSVVYTEEEGYVTADVAEAKGFQSKLSGTKFRKMSPARTSGWLAFKSSSRCSGSTSEIRCFFRSNIRRPIAAP